MNRQTSTLCIALLLSSIGAFVACSSSPQPTDDPETTEALTPPSTDNEFAVQFRDRTIDLHPFVQGFPYTWFTPSLEHGFMLFFDDTPQGNWLRVLDLDDGPVDLDEARQVNEIDWSTRSFRPGTFNEFLGLYVFLGDEKNDEIFNIYTVDLDSGDVEALTEVDYIYGYGFSDDDRLMGYVARQGTSEPFTSCLRIRDLENGDEWELWCDEGGADRLTWTAVEFSPDDESVLVRMQHDGDRNKTNLAVFETRAPGEPRQLLERGIEHLSLWTIAESFDGESLIYSSSARGVNDLYRYDLETGESSLLVELERDITSATLLEDDTGQLLFATLDLPYGTLLQFFDPTSGELVWSREREESVSIRDYHEDKVVLAMSSVATPFQMERAALHRGLAEEDSSAANLTKELFASVPQEIREQLIQCETRRLEYPTFDHDEQGEPRMIHAYLFEPRDPPSSEKRIAQITAFYGGYNGFYTNHQILCAAGITTLSPAVRGSRGFGAHFAALNNGDLGGDDIVDLFYAARWMERELGLKAHQIGVHGGSHGGYAAMRALTFPPYTNNHDDVYPFGWGFSHAGISDLLHFHQTSNIPDWLVLLAGDPETEQDKLKERSPLHHVERLISPLLLTHGSHDSRVPVDESRRFAEAAAEHDLPVVYEEFEGQGHGISGLTNRLRYYRAIFEFLETHVDPRLDAMVQDD